jgi:hypothetical protein
MAARLQNPAFTCTNVDVQCDNLPRQAGGAYGVVSWSTYDGRAVAVKTSTSNDYTRVSYFCLFLLG